MHATLNKIEKFLLNFDIYGHKVDFFINSKTMVKSKVGGILSLVICGLCLYVLSNNWKAWLAYENLQTIVSSQSFSVAELLNANKSYEYSFDYHNYYMYYVLQANLPNTPSMNYEDLSRYFVQSFVYSGINFTYEEPLDFEKCLRRDRNTFLLQSNDDLQNPDQITSNLTVCLKENYHLKMGLLVSQKILQIISPSITYRVSKCQNSSENNYSCASDSEIAAISKYVTIQTSVPKSIYDFNNPKNPRKRTYDYNLNKLDMNSKKVVTANLISVYLYTDQGYINDDYFLDSVDFNIDSMQYESISLGSGENVLFEQNLQLGLNQIIYYRKNDKFYNIISNFGGMVNVLFLLGKLICYSYNMLLMRHKLINISFSNLDKKEQHKLIQDESSYDHNENGFKFSIFSLLCPSVNKEKVYNKALSNLYEYMGVENIIRRLQDIDKFKLLMLDNDQRRIFELLPKPGIQSSQREGLKPSLTLDSIRSSKKKTYRKRSCKKLGFLLNGDPLNKRMFDMLDPGFKEELDHMRESISKEESPRLKFTGFPELQLSSRPILQLQNLTSTEIEIPDENKGAIEISPRALHTK